MKSITSDRFRAVIASPIFLIVVLRWLAWNTVTSWWSRQTALCQVSLHRTSTYFDEWSTFPTVVNYYSSSTGRRRVYTVDHRLTTIGHRYHSRLLLHLTKIVCSSACSCVLSASLSLSDEDNPGPAFITGTGMCCALTPVWSNPTRHSAYPRYATPHTSILFCSEAYICYY